MKRSAFFALVLIPSVFAIAACSGSDGSNGLVLPAKPVLLEQRQPTAKECPGQSGVVFIQGYDDTGDGIIDTVLSSTPMCTNPGDNTITITSLAEYDPDGCAACHSKQAVDVIKSRHVLNNVADATEGYMKDNAQCIVCHTGNVQLSDATYTAVGAKSGLTCSTCHFNVKPGSTSMIHITSVANAGSCLGCHKDVSSHASQGHFAPFTLNIAKAYDNATAPGKPAHGVLNGRTGAQCAICHGGEFTQKVVMNENPRTAVQDAAGVWSTAGGSSYYFEKQWVKLFGSTNTTDEDAYIYRAEALGFFEANHNDGTVKAGTVDASKGSVYCQTCHNPHDATNQALRTSDIKDSSGSTVFSAEFLLCTTCHMVQLDATKIDNASGYSYTLAKRYTDSGATLNNGDVLPGADSDLVAHHANSPTASHSIIPSHFTGKMYSEYNVNTDGNVTVTNATVVDVTGFGINAGDRNACTMCHDPHNSTVFGAYDNTTMTTFDKAKTNLIVQNWAKSGHNDYSGAAFSREFAPNCNRCHNGRAAVYNFAGEDRLKLNRTAFAKDTQKGASIACMTCHDPKDPKTLNGLMASMPQDNATSNYLRMWMESSNHAMVEKDNVNPEWVDEGLTQKILADGTKVDLAVLASAVLTKNEFGVKSMTCLVCHAGRNTGERIIESHLESKAGNYPAGTAPTDRALTDYVHYMDAAGTIKMNGPYNFPGMDYRNLRDAHRYAIVSCNNCHDMKGHTFKVYEENGAAIPASALTVTSRMTAAPADGSGCAYQDGCHKDTVRALESKKGFDAAIAQLKAQMASRGFYYSQGGIAVAGLSSHEKSHWSTDAAGTVPVEKWPSAQELAAAYNTQYFDLYDKGGWAHSMTYTRQILWDSMAAIGGSFAGDAALWMGSSRPN